MGSTNLLGVKSFLISNKTKSPNIYGIKQWVLTDMNSKSDLEYLSKL
jgi:hypothetical protein